MNILSSKEAITRVKEAEAQADKVREQAEREAALRVEKNEKACADRMARAIADTETELKR